MASSSSSSTLLFRNSCTYTFTYILILTFSAPAKHALGYCYTSIISIGDSLADTGNLLRLLENSSADQPPNFSLPPYGKTYFHRPTGRFSDGRLVIDFIAQHLGLPLVPPYFGGQNASSVKFQGGVNFAVGGATALEDEFFERRGIHIPYKNVSLGMQLGWFKEMLPSLCHTPLDCKKLLESSLILMGEIGGNDYNNAFYARRSLEELQSFVPSVVDVIAWAINELIELGATTLMVPGNLPIGCLPVYLTEYMSPNKEDYDPETGCLIWLNEFSEYHNEMLRIELSRIQQQHPHLTIIYADYYNAAMLFYRSPSSYGFSSATTLTACCGVGGPYNFNSSAKCGSLPSRACDDPSSYISWDGIHFTEAAYKLISKALLEGPYTIPHIKNPCITLPVSSFSF
ncbi:GDSL esterase/lipase At1g28570-like isoform X2 [Actinidia eriantha]|uniref:GDSL esterase/lipase At1g28570-like isoform X2 n=1 Tax=Actinidia eriantha TaxID=165200 RepID=UPI002588C70C|nr:GDSL esterase/lipase At1g28570-like isoform X2 [Actinidia eriantha]